ncbi:unnamed protein product [Caenorhabditis auriculariae]|uniref:Phosphoribosyltransferase domain-containing protein n=1 Tax=Caenorhabditis auriculariae TaxID=2777116 RepID=A0A8S1GPD8_9PELO|nr:unnamed protein product [Caenorhabditis auriculariae]
MVISPLDGVAKLAKTRVERKRIKLTASDTPNEGNWAERDRQSYASGSYVKSYVHGMLNGESNFALDKDLERLKQCGWLAVIPKTNQIEELQTILKDRETSHPDFVFYADRLMRIVIEEGLNRLPFSEKTVVTPSGVKYNGIQFARGNCGVSVCRSGEAMEIALRQCCRSIRIGKVLLGEEQRILYARLMSDISQRRILILYPTISTGITTCRAIRALKDVGVSEENMYLITLFITPAGVKRICSNYPELTIITSDVTTEFPHSFAMKYYGTD